MKTPCVKLSIDVFLSTLSLRRATGDFHPTPARRRYFYPRSPCGERPPQTAGSIAYTPFLSTLSLRRATQRKVPCPYGPVFLSTLSLRRATGNVHYMGVYEQISIHALLAESDQQHELGDRYHQKFLSTLSLRRATDITDTVERMIGKFLSTLSLRRATVPTWFGIPRIAISIHALLAESDFYFFWF